MKAWNGGPVNETPTQTVRVVLGGHTFLVETWKTERAPSFVARCHAALGEHVKRCESAGEQVCIG